MDPSQRSDPHREHVAVTVLGAVDRRSGANQEEEVNLICPLVAGFFIGFGANVFALFLCCATGCCGGAGDQSNEKDKQRISSFQRGIGLGIGVAVVSSVCFIIVSVIIMRTFLPQ